MTNADSTRAVENRPLSLGGGGGGGGGCGQRRRQLALLLGSISSAPSTAATNLSAALICNGKSKADWALSAGRGCRGRRREAWQAVVTHCDGFTALFTLIYSDVMCRLRGQTDRQTAGYL